MHKPSQYNLDTCEKKIDQYNVALSRLKITSVNLEEWNAQSSNYPAERINRIRSEINRIIPILSSHLAVYEDERNKLLAYGVAIKNLFKTGLIDEETYVEMCKINGIKPETGNAPGTKSGGQANPATQQMQVGSASPETPEDRLKKYRDKLGTTPLGLMVVSGCSFIQALDLQYRALLDLSSDAGIDRKHKDQLVAVYRDTISRQVSAGDFGENLSIFVQYHTSLFHSAHGLMLAEKLSPAELMDFNNPVIMVGWMMMNATQHKGKAKKVDWSDINSTLDIVMKQDDNGTRQVTKEDYLKLFAGIESIQPEKDKHHGNMVELLARILLTRMTKNITDTDGAILQINEELMDRENRGNLESMISRGIEFDVTSEVFEDLHGDISLLLDALYTYDVEIYKNLVSRVLETFLLIYRHARKRTMDHETGKAHSWTIPKKAAQSIWGGNAERFREEITALFAECGMCDDQGALTVSPLVSGMVKEMTRLNVIDRKLLIAKKAAGPQVLTEADKGNGKDEQQDADADVIRESIADDIAADVVNAGADVADSDDDDEPVDLLDEPLDVLEQMFKDDRKDGEENDDSEDNDGDEDDSNNSDSDDADDEDRY